MKKAVYGKIERCLKEVKVFAELDGNVASGIIFDNEGHMIVGKDKEILRISPKGEATVLCSFREIEAKKHYYFESPLVWDMVLADEGVIYAAAQDRILKISKDGKFETLIEGSFDGFLGISGLECDKEGNLYFTHGGHIMKLTLDGKTIDWFDGKKIGLESLFSLRFDLEYRNLYATDFYTSSLYRIPLTERGGAESPVLIIQEPIKDAKPYGAPLNMVYDRNGNLYSSLDCKAQILKMDAEGNLSFIHLNAPVQNHYIAFGGKGFDDKSIYFTTYDGKTIYQTDMCQLGQLCMEDSVKRYGLWRLSP